MAVRFDAQTDRYSVATGALPGTVAACTVTWWAKLAVDRDTYSAMWSSEDSGGTQYLEMAARENGTGAHLYVEPGADPDDIVDMAVGTWYRFAATIAADAGGDQAVTLYGAAGAGGALASDAGGGLTANITPDVLYIGAASFAGEWLDGSLANFKQWSRVLTEVEIEAELASWDVVDSDDIVRHYKFQVAETTDYSGNGNTLTAGATATTTDTDDPPILYPGGAVRFDAGTDRLSLSGITLAADAVTVTAWAYLEVDRDAYSTMVMLVGGDHTFLQTDSSGTNVVCGSFTDELSSGAALTVGAWHRVALTLDNGEAKIYAAAATGGVTSATDATFAGLPASFTAVSIGADSGGGDPFNGRLAHVRVWAGVLSQSEIQAEWASVDPVRTADLFTAWPLADADDLADVSGNGRDLTAGSTAVTSAAGPPIGVRIGDIGALLSGAETTTAQVPVPDDVVADSVIVVMIRRGDATDEDYDPFTALPSGFQLVPDNPGAASNPVNSVVTTTLDVAWKRATGADSGTYDFTWTRAQFRTAFAVRIDDCRTAGNPFEVDDGALGVGATNDTPAVAVTTTGADRLLLWGAATWDTGTWTFPSGFAQQAIGSFDLLAIGSKLQGAAGGSGSLVGSQPGHSKRAAWVGAFTAEADEVTGELAGALAALPALGGALAASVSTSGALAGGLSVLPALGGALAGTLTTSGALAGALAVLPALDGTLISEPPTATELRAGAPYRVDRFRAGTPLS